MKQAEQVGCGLLIKLGCFLIVVLISFSFVSAEENSTTTVSTTTTIDSTTTTTTVETTTTIEENQTDENQTDNQTTTTTTTSTTTIDQNQSTTTTTITTTTTVELIPTYISVGYESEIEEGETTLIRVYYTYENGTVEEAIGTIKYNGETHQLEFNESTGTYDYLFSETEGSYDFFINISKGGFEPQHLQGTITVSEVTTTSSTTSSTTTATTTINDYYTTLQVSAPSSLYSNETANFEIEYTCNGNPIEDADVILTISHEEINPITNESYVYSEAYFIPWIDSSYKYSLSLEAGTYNYTIIATKEGKEAQEYRGNITVLASKIPTSPESPKIKNEKNIHTVGLESSFTTKENDIVPKESLKAGLPIDGANSSEMAVIFTLFGLMCVEVFTMVSLVHKRLRREEEMMKLLLIMVILNNSGEDFGDLYE